MRSLGMVLTILAFLVAVAAAQQQSTERPSAGKAMMASPINLNTATATQLESLPGIGARTAERIVEYRTKNGGFKKIEELLEISRSCPYLLMILDFCGRSPVS